MGNEIHSVIRRQFTLGKSFYTITYYSPDMDDNEYLVTNIRYPSRCNFFTVAFIISLYQPGFLDSPILKKSGQTFLV